MRAKYLLWPLMALCLLTLIPERLDAGFSNTGRFKSRNLNLHIKGTLDNDGYLLGLDSLNLSCDTLSGKGIIRSPEMEIRAHNFAFTGTICCTGHCLIVTKHPVDESQFRRLGGGMFTYLLEKDEVRILPVPEPKPMPLPMPLPPEEPQDTPDRSDEAYLDPSEFDSPEEDHDLDGLYITG